ncbi:MAG TPA: hypothetical protein VGO47_00980 [Chlamydiales bacterium]|nr:hypothetical protein [Chlamydiales bacterium]
MAPKIKSVIVDPFRYLIRSISRRHFENLTRMGIGFIYTARKRETYLTVPPAAVRP